MLYAQNKSEKGYLCSVYLPPGDTVAATSFISKLNLHLFNTNDIILICGVFNCSSTQWIFMDDHIYLEPFNIEQKCANLIDTLSHCNLG